VLNGFARFLGVKVGRNIGDADEDTQTFVNDEAIAISLVVVVILPTTAIVAISRPTTSPCL
jgi:hypothetical protein